MLLYRPSVLSPYCLNNNYNNNNWKFKYSENTGDEYFARKSISRSGTLWSIVDSSLQHIAHQAQSPL